MKQHCYFAPGTIDIARRSRRRAAVRWGVLVLIWLVVGVAGWLL